MKISSCRVTKKCLESFKISASVYIYQVLMTNMPSHTHLYKVVTFIIMVVMQLHPRIVACTAVQLSMFL